MTISIGELIVGGYLFDLNRRWAHPLGLEVRTAYGRLEFCDLRSLPGGALFGGKAPPDAARKAESVEEQRRAREEWRRANLGAAVELVEGYEDAPRPLAGVAPGGWTLLGELAADFGAAVGEEAEAVFGPDVGAWLASSVAEAALVRLLSPLLSRAALDGSGRLVVGEPPAPAVPDRASRLRFLLAEVPELQERHGQLYPEEVEAVARVAGDGADLDAGLAEMERLHGLAQPGMRFFRGDKAARAEFDGVRQVVGAQVARIMATRSELARYVEGELAPEAVQDRAGILAEIDRQIAALEPQAAEASAELRRAQLEAQEAEGRLALLRTARWRLVAVDGGGQGDAPPRFGDRPMHPGRVGHVVICAADDAAPAATDALARLELLGSRVRHAIASLREAEDTDIILNLPGDLEHALTEVGLPLEEQPDAAADVG